MYRDFKKVLNALDMYPLFLKCLVRYKMCNNYPKYLCCIYNVYIDRENIKVVWISKEIIFTDLKQTGRVKRFDKSI